ncbi:AAA family ATPase [Endothiovibrio diazotrophicus]
MTAIPTTLGACPTDRPVTLPATATWPATVHQFDARTVDAIRAAQAAERPLLVRGEPGTGKSQLARAAAHCLGRLFVAEVIHARSEAQELQWRFDAVARLGEAQALAAAGGGDVRAQLDPLHFLSPGPLWWVFDWDSAEAQYRRCRHPQRRPTAPEEWTPKDGSVLLIDEIDKADADLPNGLLETLGNGAFTVPYCHQPIGLKAEVPPPLVIITTNEERELPGAFVRRCLVLHLGLPEEEDELVAWLMERGAVHFGERCGEPVRREAAVQLWRDRQEALRQGITPPGQAEYLDLLRAVGRLAEGEESQLELLGRIQGFMLQKFSGLGSR